MFSIILNGGLFVIESVLMKVFICIGVTDPSVAEEIHRRLFGGCHAEC